MTAKEYIRAAMRKINAVNSGQDPKPEELTDGLEALNVMLDSWWAEGLPVWYFSRETFTLVVGQNSYTIGDGGDFDTPRPKEIVSAYFKYANSNEEYPIDIVSQRDYDNITLKTTQGRPYKLFYNPEYPKGKVFIGYTPDQAYTLRLNMRKKLAEITSLTSEIAIPEEFNRAIIFNLAVDIADEFGFDVPARVARIATESKDVLLLRHSADMPNDAELDDALVWRSGGLTKGEFNSGL